MRYFLGLLIFVLCHAQASHIVGGDISIQQIKTGESLYSITLTLLFDDVNANTGAERESLPLGIFRQNDHKKLGQHVLEKVSNSDYLQYTDPICMDQKVVTKIIKYSATVVMEPDSFIVPTYYVIENCCRNNIITNIIKPGDTGQTFYAEFPAVWSQGILIDNSSPRFNILKGDFACVDRDLLLDFSANDSDGDSLVYDLCAPLKGHSDTGQTMIIPDPVLSGPYPPVRWAIGYDSVTMVDGGFFKVNSATGMVTIHAKREGINVFTVRCSEYRKGIKIGEIRRDYQIYIKNCYPVTQPSIIFKKDDNVYTDSSLFTVHYGELFTLVARDSLQVIDLVYQPINFNLSSLKLKNTSGFVKSYQDSLRSEFSWNDCNTADSNKLYMMRVVVTNHSCPQPSKDTILLKFKLKGFVNKPPVSIISPEKSVYNVLVSDKPIDILIKSFNVDSSEIKLSRFEQNIYINNDYNLSNNGFKQNIKSTKNLLRTHITFTPSCERLSRDSVFKMRYISNEVYCNQWLRDTLYVEFRLRDRPYSADSLVLTNIFTPNGDQLNDVFILKGMPPDRCNDAFEKAYIYNRWGVKILETDDRQLHWDGNNALEGNYLYEVKYQKSHYKGYVELRR